MNKRFIRVVAFLAFSISTVFSIIISTTSMTQPVFAGASDAATIMKKTLLNGLSICYNDTYMQSSLKPSNLSSVDNLFTSKMFSTDGSTDSTIKLPNNVGNSVALASVSCKDLFLGRSGLSGLFSTFNRDKSTSTNTQKVALLKNLGYVISEATSDVGCISVSYETVVNNQLGNKTSTNQVCLDLVDGKTNLGFQYGEGMTIGTITSPLYLYYDPGDYSLALMSDDEYQLGVETNEVGLIYLNPYINIPWEDVKSDAEVSFDRDDFAIGNKHYKTKVEFPSDSSETFAEATRGSNAAIDALHFFSGEQNATFSTYSFTSLDKYPLYTAYLNNELRNNSNVFLGSSSECNTTLDSVKGITGYAVRNGDKWCALYGVSTGDSYNIIEKPMNNKLVTSDFSDVINELMGLDYAYLESQGVVIGELEGGQMGGGAEPGNPGGSDSGGGADATTIEACYQAAASLGWFLCPLIKAVSAATSGLYTVIIEPFLGIGSDVMKYGGNGTYHGWAQFRNFANILFVIAFAIIILAQVTGIGISNYNIKKVLPRFIMVVILVNVSFILCQVVVDVSNILGYSLRSLFENMAHTVTIPSEVSGYTLDKIISSLAETLFTAVVVGGAGVAAALTWNVWLIPFLIGLLGCAIGVFFFFIILGVRQAGVVILVAVAPIAIVCYALPNTKSIFDKWKKMLTALILVYPICGALMGAGQYASALLLAASDGQQDAVKFFYYLTAMLVSVAPFFMIPSIVKGSMMAMGNLGMKISSFGKGVSGRFNKAAMGSRAVQEHQAEQKRRRALSQDQATRRRIQGRTSENSLGNRARRLIGRAPKTELSNREATRLARAQAGINRATSETSAALEQTWDNDGTANDFDKMGKIFQSSAEAYAKDENDFEALERMNAAMRVLGRTEPGQDTLLSAFNRIEENAANDQDQSKRMNTQKALKKMSNDLVTMHGDKIKKDAPILMKKLKNYQKMEIDGNFNTDGMYDNSATATGGHDGRMNLSEVISSTADLSPATMPGMNESTLKTYIDAIHGGQINRNSEAYQNVTSAARRALTDPHIKGQVKGKVATLLQQLADMDYTGPAAGTVAATTSMARANESELSRIQSGLRDTQRRIDFGTPEESEAAMNHRNDMLNTLEQTMVRGMMAEDGDEHSLSSANAAQIDKILKENGVNLADRFQSGAFNTDGSPVRNLSPEQFNQRYESMMGLKIDHSDAPTNTPGQQQSAPSIITTSGPDNLGIDDLRNIARNHPAPGQQNSAQLIQGRQQFNAQGGRQSEPVTRRERDPFRGIQDKGAPGRL